VLCHQQFGCSLILLGEYKKRAHRHYMLHLFSWYKCSRLVIVIFIITCSSVRYLFCWHRCNIHWDIFLNNFYFSYVLMGCRRNIINFFHKFLIPSWLLMSYSLFEKSLYYFYMTVLIYILCNVLNTKMVNNFVYWFLSFKIWSLKNCPYT
jgi:hypothetical protein